MAAVRAACSPAVWSRGVQLHRGGLVLGQARRGTETEVRVGTQGQDGRAFTVSLMPEDEDWSCDCPGDEGGDACAHVAAAVIALRQGGAPGTAAAAALPATSAPAAGTLGAIPRVLTLLERLPGGLGLRQELDSDGRRQPLAAVPPQRLQQLQNAADRRLALTLRGHRQGPLSPRSVGAVLAALQEVEGVRLDGYPVRVGPPWVAWVLRLGRRHGQLHLQLLRRPAADERFANGIVRHGDTLHAEAQIPLPPPEIETLRRGETLANQQLGEFLEMRLPRLRAALPVEQAADALPQAVPLPPSLQVETFSAAPQDGFAALATLVYRDAAGRICGRVDAGSLRYLGGPLPLRQRAAERQVEQQAEALGLRCGRRHFFLGAAAVAMADRLAALCPAAVAATQPAATFCSAAALVPQIDLADGQLQVHFGKDGQQIEAAAVMAAWNRQAPLVQLADQSWAPLPQNFLAQHGHTLLELLAARRPDQTLPRAAQLFAAQLCAQEQLPIPADLRPLLAAFGEHGELPPAPLAPALDAVLRPYQRDGVAWLHFLRQAGLGALLADDMGLGKTLQALCCLRAGEATLVVAPTSVLPNWQAELLRFRPELQVSLYHGSGRSQAPTADVVLTSYGLLRLDVAQLSQRSWHTVILDEAQTIKNPHSQIARAARQLPAQFRLALCGTPLENRPEELWSQMEFLNPGLLGPLPRFVAEVARPLQEGAVGVAARLQRRLRPFFLRRKKIDVAAFLPSRTEQVQRCVLGAAERALYDTVRAATVPAVLRQLRSQGNVMQALEALLRLRQACCHPQLLPGALAPPQPLGSAKVAALLATLDEILASGHRAIIFSQWTRFLDLIESPLRRQNIAFVRLDGSTRDRGAVVAAFQADDGPPVMLISLRAGGTGLNLTAADHVFLMDPWWNPAVEDQAADRAHRIGQLRPVIIHKMIAENSVEERIIALQARKRAMAEAALTGLDRAPQLSRDELAEILQD